MTGTVPTIREVAEAFEVSERSIKYWLAAGAPGKPGAYDLAAIEAWRVARPQAPLADLRRQRLALDIALKESRLETRERAAAQRDGQFIDTAIVEYRLVARIHAALNAPGLLAWRVPLTRALNWWINRYGEPDEWPTGDDPDGEGEADAETEA